MLAPLPTMLTSQHATVVVVNVQGCPYVMTDISMRLLTPRELARGQGFPDHYRFVGNKTNQIAQIGNSVVPAMARLLALANFDPAEGAVELFAGV